MEAYINGIGAISAQDSLEGLDYHASPNLVNGFGIKCIEPDYKAYINPAKARRMSRMVKMGVVAALKALKEGDVTLPDAIISGTAMGCLQDTEKFLNSIIANDEQLLTPTSFIQSTHNTLGAQIALLLECRNYNFTYVQKGFSFENALLDGLMKLAEGDCENVLVGGHDEMTDNFYQLYDRISYWKKTEGETVLGAKTDGAYCGEGAAFFALSNTKIDKSYAKVTGVDMLYKPQNEEEISNWIFEFLEANKLPISDVDVVLYGINGDQRFDAVFYTIKEQLFKSQTAAYYKHLSGEYATSASYALYLAANMLKLKAVPDYVLMESKEPSKVQNVLIFNGFMGENYSLTLVQQC